ncbi:MAG: hypothetical protein ACSHWY_07365 [Octadecabacter sp.]
MPPKLPSIALHIGAHKTASSHLQKVLYNNREYLSDEGIRCYGPGYLRQTGQSLAELFGMSWSEGDPPKRAPHDQLRFLAKGRKRLVFTEENFVGTLSDKYGRVSLPVYPNGVERVTELAAALAPIEPQVFLAVRNPATYMASAYSQGLLEGAHIGPRTFRARNDWRKIDWADYVTRLRDIAGIGEVLVWRQEDYDLSHRLILRRLLRWKVGAKITTVDGRVNVGLSSKAVRKTLQWAQEGKTGKLAGTAREQFPINDDNRPFYLYAASTMTAAQDIYDAQMAQIDALDGVTVLHPPSQRAEGLKSPDKTVT